MVPAAQTDFHALEETASRRASQLHVGAYAPFKTTPGPHGRTRRGSRPKRRDHCPGIPTTVHRKGGDGEGSRDSHPPFGPAWLGCPLAAQYPVIRRREMRQTYAGYPSRGPSEHHARWFWHGTVKSTSPYPVGPARRLSRYDATVAALRGGRANRQRSMARGPIYDRRRSRLTTDGLGEPHRVGPRLTAACVLGRGTTIYVDGRIYGLGGPNRST